MLCGAATATLPATALVRRSTKETSLVPNPATSNVQLQELTLTKSPGDKVTIGCINGVLVRVARAVSRNTASEPIQAATGTISALSASSLTVHNEEHDLPGSVRRLHRFLATEVPYSSRITIADTSLITAEVKVDETDIVNVKLGQPAEVSIDAIPKKTFKGTVTEIGNNALLRSTGVATSQSLGGTQEAPTAS